MDVKVNILIQIINAIFTLSILVLGYLVTARDLGGSILSDTEACKLSPIDSPQNMERCIRCDGWVIKGSVHCDVCEKCVH